MTNPDLLARIQAVANRTRVHDRIGAEVLAEIEKDHVIVEKDRWERVLAIARAGDGMYIVDFEVKDDDLFDEAYWERERRERDLAPIRPDAAASETAEG